ncbi:hypothetical protein CURTO8I2_180139 [Curtobacterium sp. 8I-2]|nr:hypothetical protein CURTO8I2_180139 [Curtobacterium sp. 8I-2]
MSRRVRITREVGEPRRIAVVQHPRRERGPRDRRRERVRHGGGAPGGPRAGPARPPQSWFPCAFTAETCAARSLVRPRGARTRRPARNAARPAPAVGAGAADRGPNATNATAPAQTTATAAAITVARRRGSVGRIGKISP